MLKAVQTITKERIVANDGVNFCNIKAHVSGEFLFKFSQVFDYKKPPYNRLNLMVLYRDFQLY